MAITKFNPSTRHLVEEDGNGGHRPVVLDDQVLEELQAIEALISAEGGVGFSGAVKIQDATDEAKVAAVDVPASLDDTKKALAVHDAAPEPLPAGTNVIGAMQDAGPAAGAGTMKSPQHGDMSAGTTDLTGAPTSGQKWVITDIFISTAAAAEVSLVEETSGTVVFGPILMPANGYAQFTPRSKLKLATADKKVLGKSSTADHVTIQLGAASEA